jgi:xylulokinase
MGSYVIAHDLGTTGNKATLYDAEGKLVGSAFYGYGTEYAHTGWAEQNPEDWWQAVCISTKKLLEDTGVAKDDIACITFSGQMMGAVPLDANARPIANAIIWADTRSVAQERWIAERIAPDEIYRITGHRLSASYSLEKILWLRDHRPDIYNGAYKFVHAKDAMIARLTGVFVTDPSDASGMNLFDINTWEWSGRIIEATGLDAAKLPDIHDSTAVAGTVSAAVANEVGVAAGTPVVIGGGDGSCAATGAGVVRGGSAYGYVGSSSWIALASDQPLYDPSLRTFTFAHIVPHMTMPTGTMQAAGASYQWMRDTLCPAEVLAGDLLGMSSYEVMNTSAAKSPPGANGLLYLPYLLGERAPRWNPNARGAFVGLDIRHDRADMIRAVLEGVTFNLRVILDAFNAQGANITAVRLIGGGASGRFWNQIFADIFGLPIYRLAILEEATSMGAALAGGIGVGLYPGWELSEQMNPIADTIEPDMTAHARYNEIYPIFNAAYDALVPVYDLLARVK